MSKNIILILSLVILLIILSFIFLPKKTNKDLSVVKIKLGNTDYQIEIARTSSQKSIGLSNRDSLCPNCGMIFIFDKDTYLPFWMKDTRIPLDMIWINSQNQIVDIQHAIETNSLKAIQNSTPAKYVLELNLDDSKKLNLKIGDIIDLSNLK